MPPHPHDLRRAARVSGYLAVLVVAVAAAVAARPAPTADAPIPAPPPVVVPSAAPAPAGLPTIDYWGAARGLPADPAPGSTAALTEGLRPTGRRVVYEAPGGAPRAFLPPSISGLPVTVPIVARRTGWVAVLLPSINRRIGWLTDDGWVPRPLRDHLVLRRRTHQLSWSRDGRHQQTWTVTTGAPETPTPPGRTFVLGRVRTSGAGYAGMDALALGSVPDDPAALPPSLRAGHTAIHGWHHPGTFGRAVSNGCIRVPREGLRTLLRTVAAGTVLTVIA